MKTIFPALVGLSALAAPLSAEHGQATYVVPAGLVRGGAFIDRFLPMKPLAPLRSDVWGVDAVKPRDVANGVEDAEYSYWCTSVVRDADGRYHNFLARWREDSPKGHMEWPNSHVVHAVGKNPLGPFEVKEEIGKGHNVTAYQAKTGAWILYVIDGCYRSASLDGPWQYGKLSFDNRGRKGVDMTNSTFARREDGSMLMVNRSGEIWISRDGDREPFERVTNKRVYPSVNKAAFEDPVVWKDDVQYNLIVNDWYGRAAYYLRSRDGITWDWDQGLAYGPGIFRHEDGRVEDWYKIERPRVMQDERGRATHLYFAVIDAPKKQDLPRDNHSSKAIGVEIVAPRTVQVRREGDRFRVALDIAGLADVDHATLRFGAPSKVDFGQGATASKLSPNGDWLLAEFAAADCGFTAADRTAKLLASTRKGDLVLGYAALPGEPGSYPLLSAHGEVVAGPIVEGRRALTVEIGNYGLAASAPTEVVLTVREEKNRRTAFTSPLPALAPYEKTRVTIPVPAVLAPDEAKVFLEIGIRDGGDKNDLWTELTTPRTDA